MGTLLLQCPNCCFCYFVVVAVVVNVIFVVIVIIDVVKAVGGNPPPTVYWFKGPNNTRLDIPFYTQVHLSLF